MTQSHTAGTAGDGYLVEKPDHDYQPDPRLDYGQRPVCTCGRELTAHLRLRSLEQPARPAS